MDLSVARQKRPTVRAPRRAPNKRRKSDLLKLIDVNASAPGSDFVGCTEPKRSARTLLWCVVVSAIGQCHNAQPRSKIVRPFPIPMQNDVYVADSDFSQADVPVRVAVSVGASPPISAIDRQDRRCRAFRG